VLLVERLGGAGVDEAATREDGAGDVSLGREVAIPGATRGGELAWGGVEGEG
jgi:hypothetical protein